MSNASKEPVMGVNRDVCTYIFANASDICQDISLGISRGRQTNRVTLPSIWPHVQRS